MNQAIIRVLNCDSYHLDLSNLGLTKLPKLPKHITSLNISNNKLRNIPSIPQITDLDCRGNLLQRLPYFPNLEFLSCGNNKLGYCDLLGYLSSKRKKCVIKIKRKTPLRIKTLKDVIITAKYYNGTKYNKSTLKALVEPLEQLDKMIGMEKLKQDIIDMILYYIQELNLIKGVPSENDCMHTVIYGPPGVGKTTFAHILAKIYHAMGFLPTDNVIIAKREDFIGKYQGYTETKTKSILEESIGGVLLIDEVYSLSSTTSTGTGYSKIVVDCLNQFLSENKNKFACIIAGYKKEVHEGFFSMNPGLERRFPWKFEIKEYSHVELFQIFQQKIKIEDWKLEKSINSDFFKDKKQSFPFYGGDIDNFFSLCKTVHSRRIFGTSAVKKLLTINDLTKSFDVFHKEESNPIHSPMYL